MNDEKGKAMKKKAMLSQPKVTTWRVMDMKPISDERREVAARLRKCGAELSFLGADCETGLHVIDKVIGCREGDSWERFLCRLADLIDPTCHVIGTTSQDWSDGSTVYTHDLSCGHTCRTDWTEPPAFCDECGARVIDDGR